jgi:AraC-like DNA-binding protein
MASLVRAAALTNFHDVARAAGVDPLPLLREAGLSEAALREPELKLPADKAARLLELAAAASGLESFGLRMAETRRLSNLGPVGLLMRDQPTLRDSLLVLLRYHVMVNGALALAVEESAGVVVIREDVIVGHQQPVRQSVELAIGVMLRLMRQCLGPQWQPRRVCFAHPAPRDVATHLRVFGHCVEFNHDFNGIVCARTDLDTPNPNADPAMSRYAQQLLDSALGPAEQAPTLLDDVRHAIVLLLPSGRCTIEQVADSLGVVCRTVQRRLADQGLTFSGLVNELRVELATRHVEDGERPLTDVSALLGFSAPSGFSRWYHGQFGCSPTQARARRLKE